MIRRKFKQLHAIHIYGEAHLLFEFLPTNGPDSTNSIQLNEGLTIVLTRSELFK